MTNHNMKYVINFYVLENMIQFVFKSLPFAIKQLIKPAWLNILYWTAGTFTSYTVSGSHNNVGEG
jgi:hypothetical protein